LDAQQGSRTRTTNFRANAPPASLRVTGDGLIEIVFVGRNDRKKKGSALVLDHYRGSTKAIGRNKVTGLHRIFKDGLKGHWLTRTPALLELIRHVVLNPVGVGMGGSRNNGPGAAFGR